LNRSLWTAFICAVLAAAVGGTADAKSHATPQSAVGPTETLTTTADASSFAATPAYVVPPEAQREIELSSAVSNMPSADADVKMWAGAGSAHVSAARTSEKKADAMRRFARGIISRTSSLAMSLTRDAMRFIGTPYVFGGTTSSGFDCSGYVQHVFAMLGVALPRTADAQFYAGRRTRGGLVSGDLVFFQTYEPGPSHVGIYIGGGKFVHSSSHGVMVSRLSERYWANRYLGAKRVVAFR
jgi:cell wall-associated NlpC family hydrolase